MARNGVGVYSLPQAPYVAGTVISSTSVNSNLSDIANALTQSIASDGQTTPTANLPMGGYRHTGVANATARDNYAAMGQVQDGAGIWCGTAGGTANALTLTPTPAIPAYAAGQVFRFTAGASPNTGATTVAVSGLTAVAIQASGAALTGGEIAAGRQYSILYDGAAFQLQSFSPNFIPNNSITLDKLARIGTAGQVLTSNGAGADPSYQSLGVGYPAEGRLTLTTGTPVTTGDVTAASTLFYTPYVGDRIALFDGTNWSVQTFTERSLALSGLTANRPHDVFIWNNAGTLTLELTAWTSDTARATALVRQNGVWVRSGATTRRYLGTIYTTGATTTEDSESNRFVWNAYNRVAKQQQRVDTTASWTYTLSAWRQANGSAANQYRFVTGLAEEMAEATVLALASNLASWTNSVGVGVNSTTVNSAQIRRGTANSSSAGTSLAHWRGIPAIGLTTLAWLESSSPNSTTTWFGAANASDNGQSGILGSVRV